MKKLGLLLIIAVSTVRFSIAEEGMLIPSLIAAFESDMQAMGMKLTAEQIYSVNNSSLKDAIIHFGGGCTAELVSSKGLLLTNHHCGYSQVQSHSSLEKDYLKNGFWAKNLSEELSNPGLTASRIVRIVDVTKDVLFGTENITSEEAVRFKLSSNISKLIEDATNGNHYKADIKAFNEGNDFYMIVKEEFLDVRLVGTPPNSIGKFGGDTDNWVWPRHTGDFSVFRIYAGADNKPAPFNASNKPYTPLHYLPISFKDRHVGDFTMVYGFPGTTEQHVVSNYLKFIMEKERPARILMREKSLSVIDAGMRSSDEIRIKYAAKQASIANGWKKWIGQIDGLRRMDAVSVKQDREKAYNEMAATKDSWTTEFGSLVNKMNQLVDSEVNSEFAYAMGIEYLFIGPEYFKLARGVNDLMENYTKYAENDGLEEAKQKLIDGAEGFFKNYDAGVDQQIFSLLTEEYDNQMKLREVPMDVAGLTEEIYEKSFLTNKERYIAFVKSISTKSSKKALKKLGKDKGFTHWKGLFDEFMQVTVPAYRSFSGQMDALLKNYVKGKMTMFPDAKHWPDANSTLRITYGKLEGSVPADGVQYMEHTTIDGIIAKYNTGNPDFELLPRMLELHKNKDYGDYAQDGELWVCFTGSNHTTGGNSGSPVIDANGNLMGLNFDRSWESTMSDYMFDPSRCRNITVDIRYVLWVMDKYSGAKHLVDEMTLIRE